MNRTVVLPEESDLISDAQIKSLTARFPEEIKAVSVSGSMGNGRANDGRKYANVAVTGVNPDYAKASDLEIIYGRFITENDIEGERNTAIVSDKFVKNMFRGDGQAALGQEVKVTVNGEIHVFTIAGVYAYEQTIMNISFAAEKDISTDLYIPISTEKRLAGSDQGYQSITVVADPDVDSSALTRQVKNFLGRYYENNQNFQLFAMSMESITEQMDNMMSTINTALSVIAGISLLVGGIGVMNIMLVSVTERTREIGTRKALGATNGNIRMQFVVESVIICLVGGIIGIIFGALLGYWGSSLLGAPAMPTVSSILLAAGFATAIGIFFGYYPANKAAKMDPIEALRYE